MFRDTKTSCDMGSHGNQGKSRKIYFSRYDEINSVSRHLALNYLDPVHESLSHSLKITKFVNEILLDRPAKEVNFC